MSPKGTSSTRKVTLLKLSLPYEKGDEPLDEKEVLSLLHHGMIRSAHYLWLAEQYLMDMGKLGMGEEFDEKLQALTEITTYMENRLNEIFKG